MNRSRLKLGAVALVCVALGAGAGVIANSAASTSAPASASHAGRLHARGRLGGLARRTVSATLVVHTKQGFADVTIARGTVQSASGNQLTLAEGTKTATYKTVTLTLPSNVRVWDNGQRSTSLSAVSQGQRALVIVGPRRAWVIAHTPKTP